MDDQHQAMQSVLSTVNDKRRQNGKEALRPSQQKKFLAMLKASVRRYKLIEEGTYFEAMKNSLKIAESLEQALAVRMLTRWQFDPNDELAPDDHPLSEEKILDWIETDWDNARGYLEHSDSYFERALMHLIDDARGELELWHWHDKLLDREHWSSMRHDTNSQLTQALQDLVFDLCYLWRDFVDPSLGLPRRDVDTDNPLIRYLMTVISKVVDEDPPKKMKLHTLVQTHLRPMLIKQTDDDKNYPNLENVPFFHED